MNSKVRTTISILIASAIAILFSLVLAIVNDRLFMEEIHKHQALEFIKNQPPGYKITENTTIEIDPQWPWYSQILFYSVMSCFWFFLGKKLTGLLDQKNKMLSLVVPFVHTVIFMEITFPLYFFCCYWGIRSQPTKPITA